MNKKDEEELGLEFNDEKLICRVRIPNASSTAFGGGVPIGDKIKPLTLEALEAIGKNKEITENALNGTIMPSLPLLPYPCFVSPWTVLLRPRDPEKPYVNSRTTTLISVWTLYQFLFYYRAVLHGTADKKKKVALENALNMKQEQDQWFKRVNDSLNEFYAQMKKTGVTNHRHKDATRCMFDFSRMLLQHTLDFIHILERRIHRCVTVLVVGGGEEDIPCYLTRRNNGFVFTSSAAVQTEQREQEEAREILHMIQWFSQKQTNADHKIIRTDAIFRIMEKSKSDDRCVLERFIPYATLWEYAKFMDTDGILD